MFGACCQVNFQKAIEVKQKKQHHIYEKERMGSRKLLEAAMTNDENMVRIAAADGVSIIFISIFAMRDVQCSFA